MLARSLTVPVLVALLLAGCSAPDAPAATVSSPTLPTREVTPSAIPTEMIATTPVPTPAPVGVARPAPEFQAPCWETATDAPEAAGDPGDYEVDADVRRADAALVGVGLANARRFLAACAGGDIPGADLAKLAVFVVNDTATPPVGGVHDGVPFVRIDVAHASWGAPPGAWTTVAENARLASFAYAHAWMGAAGCTSERAHAWLVEGFAAHASYGAGILARDMDSQDVGAVLWRAASASNGLAHATTDTPDAAAVFLSTFLLFAYAEDGASAMRAYCAALADTDKDAAFEEAFGITHADFVASWDAFRANPPPFDSSAGLTMPGAPPEPPCVADIASLAEAPLNVTEVGELPQDRLAALRGGLAGAWGFLRACEGATAFHRWHNLSVTAVADGDGFKGGGWTMDGDGTGVRVQVDLAVDHQWGHGPHEWDLAAWQRTNFASIGATIWLESHDCRPRDGQLPAWLREAITQYVSKSQAVGTGDVTREQLREFLWQQTTQNKVAGRPLSTWNEYQSDSWAGDLPYFAMERLVAETDAGPRAIADFCAALADGTSLAASFASAFGQRLGEVADDPMWPITTAVA